MKKNDLKQVNQLADELQYTRQLIETDAISLLVNGGGGKSHWWVGKTYDAGEEAMDRKIINEALQNGLAEYEKLILSKLKELGVAYAQD